MTQPLQDTAIAPRIDEAPFPTEHQLTNDPLDPVFTDELLTALAVALPLPERDIEVQGQRRVAAAVAALRSFDAQDPAEAMLATHAVLAHHFALECYRRAARSGTTSNLNTRLLGTAAMLSRTMNASLHTMEQQRQEEPIWIGKPGTTP
jgi:hypothetical protein